MRFFPPLFLWLTRERILITLQSFYENTPDIPCATCTQQLLSKHQQMRVETALVPCLLPYPFHCWVCNPNTRPRPVQRHFPFRLQGRPSSLATILIRQSRHLSGCQLIIMILMIFQLGSSSNLIRGSADATGRAHPKAGSGPHLQVSPEEPHLPCPPATQGPGPDTKLGTSGPPLQGQANVTPSPTTRGPHL